MNTTLSEHLVKDPRTTLEDIDAINEHALFVEGQTVVIEDELGRRHDAIVTGSADGDEPVVTVLLTCRGAFDTVEVPESRILARFPGVD
ncbi:hypothetical protein [Microbacterium sp. 77mftsu3.1]|uniref:hypothetical protein n=1 Tax=Microbacterium sp. 77mftsu3.1 TaxID=1761802 RepID=UPI0003A48018|nr:hypothetical protein [Microbacterium sp. 77mftsu3.1]